MESGVVGDGESYSKAADSMREQSFSVHSLGRVSP